MRSGSTLAIKLRRTSSRRGLPTGSPPTTSTDMTDAVDFSTPQPALGARHPAEAAAANNDAATEAILALSNALSGLSDHDTILLRAAAGAGKSVQLRRMVIDALNHPACVRVAVAAFMNRQVWPLAKQLADELGKTSVCLLASQAIFTTVPGDVCDAATVVTTASAIPLEAKVVVGTASRLGAIGEYSRHLSRLGPAGNDRTPFDVLF